MRHSCGLPEVRVRGLPIILPFVRICRFFGTITGNWEQPHFRIRTYCGIILVLFWILFVLIGLRRMTSSREGWCLEAVAAGFRDFPDGEVERVKWEAV
jgi:hypothetical protein